MTADEVRKVARLARLDLGPDEVERMTADLGAILAHMAELDAVDVAGVEPTFHAVPLDAPLREDRVAPSLDRERALAAAPRVEAGAFAVPKVLEADS